MKENIEILPKIGITDLMFGYDRDKVKSIMGDPDEVESMDEDADLKAEIWYYYEHGISIFFDSVRNYLCSYFEIDNVNATLFGEPVFDMTMDEVWDLMEANGYVDFEEEDETWGEYRISAIDAGVDFYFDDEELSVLGIGAPMDENGTVIWPKK